MVKKQAARLGPESMAQWITIGPVIALNKSSEDSPLTVRAIAVEAIRRLVGSLRMDRVGAKVDAHLRATQAGIANSGGAEAIVHAASMLARAYGQDSSLGLLQIDFEERF